MWRRQNTTGITADIPTKFCSTIKLEVLIVNCTLGAAKSVICDCVVGFSVDGGAAASGTDEADGAAALREAHQRTGRARGRTGRLRGGRRRTAAARRRLVPRGTTDPARTRLPGTRARRHAGRWAWCPPQLAEGRLWNCFGRHYCYTS